MVNKQSRKIFVLYYPCAVRYGIWFFHFIQQQQTNLSSFVLSMGIEIFFKIENIYSDIKFVKFGLITRTGNEISLTLSSPDVAVIIEIGLRHHWLDIAPTILTTQNMSKAFHVYGSPWCDPVWCCCVTGSTKHLKWWMTIQYSPYVSNVSIIFLIVYTSCIIYGAAIFVVQDYYGKMWIHGITILNPSLWRLIIIASRLI